MRPPAVEILRVLYLDVADLAVSAGNLAVLAGTADKVQLIDKAKMAGVWVLFLGVLGGVLWLTLWGVLLWLGLAVPLALAWVVGLPELLALVLGGALPWTSVLPAALMPPVLGLLVKWVRLGVVSLLVFGPLLGLVLRHLAVTLVPPPLLLQEEGGSRWSGVGVVRVSAGGARLVVLQVGQEALLVHRRPPHLRGFLLHAL